MQIIIKVTIIIIKLINDDKSFNNILQDIKRKYRS